VRVNVVAKQPLGRQEIAEKVEDEGLKREIQQTQKSPQQPPSAAQVQAQLQIFKKKR
jgi:hypothetical protein